MIAMQGGGFKVVAPTVTLQVLVSLSFLGGSATSIESVLAEVRGAACGIVSATGSGDNVDPASITAAVEAVPGVIAVLGCAVGDGLDGGPFYDVPAAVSITTVRIDP